MRMLGIGMVLLALALSGSSENTLSGTAAPSASENPIYVTFVIHFDPLPAPGGRVEKRAYESERDNLAWLADYFDQIERENGSDFVPKLTLEIAGDHAEYYSEDPVGLALLKRLYAKGHQLGVHFHTNYKAGPHLWLEARPQDTPQNRQRVTGDHIKEVDALVAQIIGTNDPVAIRKANRTITGHFIDETLAQQMGFDLFTGGRNEVLNLFFDHDVYNPWRPAAAREDAGWPLAEDVKGYWTLVPQAPVLGAIGEHFPLPTGVPTEYTQGMRSMVWQDLSIPAMKRKFWHLYLEWLHRQKSTNTTDQRVWVFGWHEHTWELAADDGAYGNMRALRDEVREYVTWLNANFINKRNGKLIAKYATSEGVANEFHAWERTHPGESSFTYPVRVRDWNAYPYQLKGLTRELMYAHYETEITAFRVQGIYVHRLLKTDGRNWRYQAGRIVSTGPIWPIYLLWSESGEKTIDFSSVLSGTMKCVTGRSGAEAVRSAAALPIGEEPSVCAAVQ